MSMLQLALLVGGNRADLAALRLNPTIVRCKRWRLWHAEPDSFKLSSNETRDERKLV